MPSTRNALAAAAALIALAAPATATAKPPKWLQLDDNGVTQPQFALANAVEETLYVQTRLDTDRDGKRDRVRIRVSRPGETESETHPIRVPVIFEHSPYRGDLGSPANHNVDFDRLPQDQFGPRADLPGQLDNYYVPRGYAVVLGESIGTFNSDGCPDVGGRAETLGTKAVIDWLNGRARAYDESGNRVKADWTTGDVGMTGVSYNGTLPNQVATTGVRGLKTIIPVSAISSWYDYYRANGLVVAPHSNTRGDGDNDYLGEDTDVLGDFIGGPRMDGKCLFMRKYFLARQDRKTGDWSRFWQQRDYLHKVKRIRASVFVVHGLNDFNVKTKAFASWWQRLKANHIPRKLWLHNRGHGGPGGPDYKLAENRWFDRWLFGVQNGITREPRVHIQREDGAYADEADWPAPGTRTARLHLAAPGALTTRPSRTPAQSFVDRGRELDTDDVLITNPDTANPNRLAYLTPPLTSAARLSGTPWVDLRMSINNRDDANLTAVLVDYGPDNTPEMVTRGWLDPQNRVRIDRGRTLRRGQFYDLSWDLQPDDHVFPAGHRIGLVVVSTDHDYTIRPLPGTQLSLDPSYSSIRLPLVGVAPGT
jgi:X-Pro dipeptidyl-peptidase